MRINEYNFGIGISYDSSKIVNKKIVRNVYTTSDLFPGKESNQILPTGFTKNPSDKSNKKNTSYKNN